jgi:copper oxidase (laccase) domain-containing protein
MPVGVVWPREFFQKQSGSWKTLAPNDEPGRHRLDIRAAAAVQLQQHGLEAPQISACPLCTLSEANLFHSWRRDQVKAVQWSGIVAQAAATI